MLPVVMVTTLLCSGSRVNLCVFVTWLFLELHFGGQVHCMGIASCCCCCCNCFVTFSNCSLCDVNCGVAFHGIRVG